MGVCLPLQVPDAIKSQYKNPPAMLAPAAVRNGELICNGIPNQDCSPQHFTSQAEQQEVGMAETHTLICLLLWDSVVPLGGARETPKAL